MAPARASPASANARRQRLDERRLARVLGRRSRARAAAERGRARTARRPRARSGDRRRHSRRTCATGAYGSATDGSRGAGVGGEARLLERRARRAASCRCRPRRSRARSGRSPRAPRRRRPPARLARSPCRSSPGSRARTECRIARRPRERPFARRYGRYGPAVRQSLACRRQRAVPSLGHGNHRSRGPAMPLINVKLIEGVFSSDQKQQIIERLTDAMVSIEGENMRQVTWCVVEEVKSGDWGIAGNASRPSTCTRSPRARSEHVRPFAARPAPGRVPAGPRRGCSLGGMRDELSPGARRRPARRGRGADARPDPGRHDESARQRDARRRGARGVPGAQRRRAPSAWRAIPRAPTSSPGCAAAARARRSRSSATPTSSTRIPPTGASRRSPARCATATCGGAARST